MKSRHASPTPSAWPIGTALGRWSTFGPYYAMFPVSFVRATVETLCPPGSAVLDPFCGRGTVPFVARVTGRPSLGVDVNAVAYLFSAAKVDPEPDPDAVIARVSEIAKGVRARDRLAANDFQRLAWSPDVLGFLKAARRMLAWRDDRTDRTVMAFLLVHLHGKAGNAVSNQMRQSKSMAPDYAVRWWTKRGLKPPELDPISYFTERVSWRYRHGVPTGSKARIVLGDASAVLPQTRRSFGMMLTSPPYYDVTNYRVDNWMRLWMLGESELPTYSNDQRYGNRERYADMLRQVFTAARRSLDDDAVIYVRTDSREFTRDTTRRVLNELWPSHRRFEHRHKPRRSQTTLFGDKGEKPGETDYLLVSRGKAFPDGSLIGFEPSL